MSLARPHLGTLLLPSGTAGGYRTDLFFFRFLVKAKGNLNSVMLTDHQQH